MTNNEPTLTSLVSHYRAEMAKIEELQSASSDAANEIAMLDADTTADPVEIVAAKRLARVRAEDAVATIEIIKQRLEPYAEQIKAAMVVEAEVWNDKANAAVGDRRARCRDFADSNRLQNCVISDEIKALLWFQGAESTGAKVTALLENVSKAEKEKAAEAMGIKVDMPLISPALA